MAAIESVLQGGEDPHVQRLIDEHEAELNRILTLEQNDFSVEIGNCWEHQALQDCYKLCVYVRPSVDSIVSSVVFELPNGKAEKKDGCFVALREQPTLVSETENVPIWVDIDGSLLEFSHEITQEESSQIHKVALPSIVRMSKDEVPVHAMHGRMHQENWRNPIQVLHNDVEARPGYQSMKAHEYNDDPRTLKSKIALFADLLRNSENALVYTGAGISTSAGINDYASKSKHSQIQKDRPEVKNRFAALPTLGHRGLTELFRNDLIKHWIQQNHDGLPQKAGFPQHHINEIHGSWYNAITNHVVPMSGTLRSDLCQWHSEWEDKTDLTIAMGTSLCGMNADSCVEVPSEKYNELGQGFGSIIVGLQRTQLDDICSLRIYAKIDTVIALLARELNIAVPSYMPYVPDIPEEAIVGPEQYKIPYDIMGKRTDDPEKMIVWDLRLDQRMRVVSGTGKGFKGKMMRPQDNGADTHYNFCCKRISQKKGKNGKGFRTYQMGTWWVETAVKGLWHEIPMVNLNPVLQKDL